jgi:hypothetical protein
MKLKLLSAITIALLIIQNNLNAYNKIGLTQEIYIKLCGIWNLGKVKGDTAKEYSWGKAQVFVNGSTVIDLGSDIPIFFTGGIGLFEITKVFKTNDKYLIRIEFRDMKEYDIVISFVDDKTIVFDDVPWFKTVSPLLPSGVQNKYCRNDGPKLVFFKSAIKGLRIREDQSLNGEIIRILSQDEKLLIIKKGKEENLKGNIRGRWVKVLTEKNEIAWCFDAYLEECR